MARPQNFLMRTGSESAQSASAADFSKAISKQPAQYRSDQPFRGVAQLGSGQYGFVIDTKEADSHDYCRLHFDLNHNGDLTDDQVIEAEYSQDQNPSVYRWLQFPRVDLSVDGEGTNGDYAFFLTVSSTGTSNSASPYIAVSLQAAAYRRGQIELGGKTRHVALIDFNSNGRFDDRIKISETAYGISPTYGDILLLDPAPESEVYFRDFDLTESQVAKLVPIDGELYDLEVSPGGDRLTLAPTTAKVGYVAPPCDGFSATVYSDQAILKISGDKSQRLPLPLGNWKLISYTIDLTGRPNPALANGDGEPQPSLGATRLSARVDQNSKPLEVAEGKTAALPFGPPFAALVTTSRPLVAGQGASLGLSLVGSGGEVCSGLTVDGGRPAPPEFTISTPDGKEVDRGDFEYG
jgi:hypothetical protein